MLQDESVTPEGRSIQVLLSRPFSLGRMSLHSHARAARNGSSLSAELPTAAGKMPRRALYLLFLAQVHCGPDLQ